MPPSLVGAYYLQPPDARAIFLHNDLLCNDTCSVTGGSITYWGGHKRKRSIFQYLRLNFPIFMDFYCLTVIAIGEVILLTVCVQQPDIATRTPSVLLYAICKTSKNILNLFSSIFVATLLVDVVPYKVVLKHVGRKYFSRGKNWV